MAHADGKKFMEEINAICAGEVERVEARLRRELTTTEKLAFECGFTIGHARGQDFARRMFTGELNKGF